MTSKIFWKLFASACILAWAVYYLLPLSDTPFDQYLLQRGTADKPELEQLVTQAKALTEEAKIDDIKLKADKAATEASGQIYLVDHQKDDFVKQHRTFFLSLKSLAKDNKVDLAKFFPSLPASEYSNLNRRNDEILNYLLNASKGSIKYGLDLAGGVGFTLSLDDKAMADMTPNQRADSLQKVIEIMDSRVNGLGVSEPIIRPRGTNSIEVQLPGVSTKDNPEAVESLQKPAILEFRMVYHDPKNTDLDPAIRPIKPEDVPPGYDILYEERENSKTGDFNEIPTLVDRHPIAKGNIVKNAFPITGESGQIEIVVNFTSEGAKIMGERTKQMVDEDNKAPFSSLSENDPERRGRMAIILDGKLYSAPQILGVFSDSCRITNPLGFSQREAFELSNVLNNPLEQPLTMQEMYEVGPTLAKEARDSSIKAGLLGTGLVVLFMLFVYHRAGLLSVITMVLNVLIILGIQASIGAILTLPGVAALVLTIGMAVDANILIYERMREELRSGKGLLNALEAGHDRALASILDSHVTSIITAIILMWLGTGPVKGFGVILVIGLISNLFCVLVFCHALLELFIGKGWFKKLSFMQLIPDTKLPFYSYRRIAIGISISVIMIGLGAIGTRGSSALGIDFRGGEEVSVHFAKEIPIGNITDLAQYMRSGEVVASYQTELGTGIQTLKIQTQSGVSRNFLMLLDKNNPDAKLDVTNASVTIIQPTVSDNLKWNALLAVGLSLLGVMIYVAFRFEVGYAVGAIVATLHDVIITVGVYVLLGGQFTTPMVAAVLMIIGYSLNDTVIVFDRVREELRLNPQLKLVQVLDLAVNKTLARTTLTSLTVFLSAVALFVFGVGVVHEFALIFMIGIATGTSSSIFIANPVFYWWHKGDRHHVEAREVLPKYEWEKAPGASR